MNQADPQLFWLKAIFKDSELVCEFYLSLINQNVITASFEAV